MTAGPPAGDDLPEGYGEALDELEELLDELEGADVDVDVLAQRVARGVALIRFCRARLEQVTADVDTVVAELVSIDEPSGDTTGGRRPSGGPTAPERSPQEPAR